MSNEYIMELMCLRELPWHDNHNHSLFLPNLDLVDPDKKYIVSPSPKTLVFHQGFVSKGKLGQITPTITIGISMKHAIM